MGRSQLLGEKLKWFNFYIAHMLWVSSFIASFGAIEVFPGYVRLDSTKIQPSSPIVGSVHFLVGTVFETCLFHDFFLSLLG